MLVISTKIKRLFDQKYGDDAVAFISEEASGDDCFYWLFSDDYEQNSDLYLCSKNEDYLNKPTAISPFRKYEMLMFLSDHMTVSVDNKDLTKEQLLEMMYKFYNSEVD